MCRSIKTLREPYVEDASEDDVRAAALQYVRKVSGFHRPAAHNVATFEAAVDAVAAATHTLLDGIEVRGGRRHTGAYGDTHTHADGTTHTHAHAS